MKYRIVVETELGGKKWYYVQKRTWFYFWCYLGKIMDITMRRYKIGCHSLEKAKQLIRSDINDRYVNNQTKIVKREYVVMNDISTKD